MPTATRTYPPEIERLRQQIARRPALIEECNQLREEIARRQQKVEDGELTQVALDKPRRELDSITRQIFLCDNEYPNQILSQLTGELREEWETLQRRVHAASKAMDGPARAHQEASERLSRIQRLHKEAENSQREAALSGPDRAANEQRRGEELAKAEKEVAVALADAKDYGEAFDEATAARDAFRNELIFGAIQE